MDCLQDYVYTYIFYCPYIHKLYPLDLFTFSDVYSFYNLVDGIYHVVQFFCILVRMDMLSGIAPPFANPFTLDIPNFLKIMQLQYPSDCNPIL